VCNLYSITPNRAAIIARFRVMNQYVGNLPPMPGVFPGKSDTPSFGDGNSSVVHKKILTILIWIGEVRRG